MHLCRLVYYSNYNMNSRGDALAKDLKQILASSIRDNSDRGITGGLIFNRKFFAQVLEGGHAAVTQTFVRITAATTPRTRTASSSPARSAVCSASSNASCDADPPSSP
jgi:hypothetical protein